MAHAAARQSALLVSGFAARRWSVVVAGAAHGGGQATAQSVSRLLDKFQPSVLFLELDRAEFGRSIVDQLKIAAERQELCDDVEGQVLPRSYFAEAVPECEAAVEWVARKRLSGVETADVVGYTASRATSPILVPIDREQLTTKRRLAQRLAQQPGQLFRARRYWGVVPNAGHREEVSAWRESLRIECPILHEVLFEERDEYMAYQILLHLDAYLAAQISQDVTIRGRSENKLELDIDTLLRGRSRRTAQQVNSALRWALDGPALGTGGLCQNAEWAELDNDFLQNHPEKRVFVLCGPAHVDGILSWLSFALQCGDRHANDSASRRFLAQNAAILPRLLLSSDSPCPWCNASTEAIANVKMLVDDFEAVMSSSKPTADSTINANKFLNHGFGPVTALAARIWYRGDSSRDQACLSTDAAITKVQPWLNPTSTSVPFVHDRLCELSRRPLPVWPAFVTVYMVFPFVLFFVVPTYLAKLDWWWLSQQRKHL